MITRTSKSWLYQFGKLDIDALTSINIELKERKEDIEIAQILSTREEGPADFPEMVVLDIKGKQHVLSSVDFPASLRDWNKIRPGSKLEITIKESIRNQKIV